MIFRSCLLISIKEDYSNNLTQYNVWKKISNMIKLTWTYKIFNCMLIKETPKRVEFTSYRTFHFLYQAIKFDIDTLTLRDIIT